MGKILCIDTATDICSVALSVDGELSDKMESIEDRSHAKLLTVLIQDILIKNGLQATDLDAVAVSQGPGSYTGLRIGVSAAKGICYASNLPLIGISTLKIIAAAFLQRESISENSVVLPMLDARRMEVYYAEYDYKLNEIKTATPLVIEEKSFADYANKDEIVLLGSGAEKCKDFLTLSNARYLIEQTNKAEYMVALAEKDFVRKKFVNVAYFEPAYLKPFIATQSKKKFF